MKRRTFLGTALTFAAASPSLAASRRERWDDAAEVLERATAGKQVDAAVLHVVQKDESFTRHFGKAASGDAMFLLGSVSKPINVTAVMTLFDQGKFQLDDRVKKFLPTFTGDGRDGVTIRHLLTHTSGLPDQLANNNQLRKQHAALTEFAAQAMRTRLDFAPGARYQYSSMGILLATRIAELISGSDILTLVDRNVFQPLGMKHSAQGLGRFKLEEMVSCQTEGAAPESGGGDPQAKEWDWNSSYWRKLGAPWGGTHASAPDGATFLGEFLGARGKVVKPETARLMIRNHNPEGFTPRGLGSASAKGPAAPDVRSEPSATPAQRARSAGPTPRAKPFALCSRRCRAAGRNAIRASWRRSASRRQPAVDHRGQPFKLPWAWGKVFQWIMENRDAKDHSGGVARLRGEPGRDLRTGAGAR